MKRAMTFLALGAVMLAVSGRAHADGAQCQTARPSVTAARAELAGARESLPARFKLADALVEASCFHDALHTLEEGLALHPRSADLQTRLRNTRSLVSEQEYFAGKGDAELAAKISRNLLRCSKLADIAACDEALKLRPDDAEILLARGDALLKASRPAEAEGAFRRARDVKPDDPRVAAQLAAARMQRQALLAQCLERSDEAALTACQGALSGESDFEIHVRMASLNQQRNQPAAALDSYVAAQALRPGDRGVALGLVALTDSGRRMDAVTLEARGSALLTLRRGREALAAFRQAQSLAPQMPTLRARIAQAETLAAAEPQTGPPAVEPFSAATAPVLVARTYSNAAEPSRSH
jgi:Flp pilus assembly protein TadD